MCCHSPRVSEWVCVCVSVAEEGSEVSSVCVSLSVKCARGWDLWSLCWETAEWRIMKIDQTAISLSLSLSLFLSCSQSFPQTTCVSLCLSVFVLQLYFHLLLYSFICIFLLSMQNSVCQTCWTLQQKSVKIGPIIYC